MCEARGLPATRIGVVDEGSDAIEVQGQFTVSLDELRSTSEGVLPGCSGELRSLPRTTLHYSSGRGAWSTSTSSGFPFGALFFCLSLTPSLLPRDWLFAGLIGGINAAIGYGIGVVRGKDGAPLRITTTDVVAADQEGAVSD